MLKYIAIALSLLTLVACETENLETTGVPGIGRRGPDYGNAGGGVGEGGMNGNADNAGMNGLGGMDPRAAQDYLVNSVGDRVFFSLDSSSLDAEAQATLQRQAKWLKENPNINVMLEGHCDERGTREYNLALGDRRATAAKNYLVSLGVPDSRITTVSYGKERPEALGSSEEAWAKNRRAVTVVKQ